MKTGQNRNYAT